MNRKNALAIKVSVKELIGELEENLQNHQSMVEKARKGFEAEAHETLSSKLMELRKGKLTNLFIHLEGVSDHTEDYKLAIEMLKWHEDDHIEIEAEDFNCYVLDRWNWRESWLTSNSKYLA